MESGNTNLRGSVPVQLTSCLFCLDSGALNEQQFCLFGQIETSQKGGQPYSDTSPYGGCSLVKCLTWHLSCKTIFFKWAKPGLFLFIFVLFSHRMDKYSTNLTINEKRVDGMLGSRTRGGRMEGTDQSTELLTP